MSEESARAMMVAGSLGRLAYALGLLLAPRAMSARGLAPPADNAFGWMTTRAFGAVHTNLSLLTLRAAIQNRDTRIALGLNLGCDFGDLVATLLEWREGELPGSLAGASAVLQAAGMATWSALLASERDGLA